MLSNMIITLRSITIKKEKYVIKTVIRDQWVE